MAEFPDDGGFDYDGMNPDIARSIQNNPRLQQKIKNMKVRQAEFEAEKKEIMRSGRVQQNCKWQWTDWDDEGKCTTKEIFVNIQLPKGTQKQQLRIKTLRQLFEIKLLAPDSDGRDTRVANKQKQEVQAPKRLETAASRPCEPAWASAASGVSPLPQGNVGLQAEYTSPEAEAERKKALTLRVRLDNLKEQQNKLSPALEACNSWRAAWRMTSHTAMLDAISAGGTSRSRSPKVLAVLRHDLELALVEDRIEDAINFSKALEAAGAPKAGAAHMARFYKDEELASRQKAFVDRVRSQAGLSPEADEPKKPDLMDLIKNSQDAPKRVDTVLLRGDLFMPLDVEGTTWHLEGNWLKIELTKDGMAGFEWPNLFKTDEFRHKKVKPFEMIGGAP